MLYKDARTLMEPGDFYATSHEGFKNRDDWESQAVRFFTRSEFSHCGIIVMDKGRVKLLEAVVPKVRLVPLSELPNSFYWLPMRRPLSPYATEYALSLEGQPYSKLEAVLGYFGLDREANGKWQCAEVLKSVAVRNNLWLNCKATPTAVIRTGMALHNPLILVTR